MEKDYWHKGKTQCCKCKRFGHEEKFCRSKQNHQANYTEENEDQGVLFYANQAASDKNMDIWLLDSGCSNHMTGDESISQELDATFKSKVKLGNSALVDVTGKGKISVQTKKDMEFDENAAWTWEEEKIERNIIVPAQQPTTQIQELVEDQGDGSENRESPAHLTTPCTPSPLSSRQLESTPETTPESTQRRTVGICDAHSADCVKTLRGHTGFLFSVGFSPQSNLIVSGSFDEAVRVCDVKTGRAVHVIRGVHSMPVASVDFNRDGLLFVSGGHDGQVMQDLGLLQRDKLWNYSSGKSLKTYTGNVNSVYCIMPTFSVLRSVPNENYIVSGSEDHCIYIWDLQGKSVLQKLEGHNDTVVSVSCHPYQKKIASAALDGDRTVRVWVQE
ncbi:hypothetical protein RJ639_017172 [Escallonia herrerae]|uniref:Retrovirus-related Pol polyprotein from transposon TNT 1-94-like beta-barrel domain-containing protein n=1 Tax=Escallonia herrerae TaxID=1293975 RepID=A0AA88VHH9_9ASTE|nr:hypothetical protein RJ639_017172 [Escallonia herrerae]